MKRVITKSSSHCLINKQPGVFLCGMHGYDRRRTITYPTTSTMPRSWVPRPIFGLKRHTVSGNVSFHTTSLRSAYQLKNNLKDCYNLLNVNPENSNISDVKEAFLKLAKEYHPDSRSKTADVQKFNQAKDAYEAIRADHEARHSMEEKHFEFDINHTAPQHRQYLEFEGIGSGTPSQRQNHYQKFRVERAVNTVSERRIEKIMYDRETSALVSLDKKAAKQVKTSNFIDRLVEDLIKEAINKGEFDNLKYTGKRLPDKTISCPYWDVSEYNLNQVLVNNGYAPEWIQAEREIRGKLQDLKADLLKARLKLGPEPLNDFNWNKWQHLQESFADGIKKLNKKVERRNLIVPLMRLQMVNFCPQREIDKVLKEYEKNYVERTQKNHPITSEPSAHQGEGLKTSFLSKIGDKIFQKMFFPDKERMEH
ncbi:dnaJ homolog subfamily C member 28-like [Asterias rubens]|uniref:dnaJ homolog subfamily C member 28-like n=1 Tax=Asterias rubens TaxID=7604 RepID=UPI001455B8BB|nr:dnaJ homolog subfamily C member 28-like [Asterias rubens]